MLPDSIVAGLTSALRVKVGTDADTIERARRILGHADERTTKMFYRLKAEVIE